MIYLVRWVVLHITIPSLTPVIFKEFKFYYSQSQYDLIFYNAFSILAKKKKKNASWNKAKKAKLPPATIKTNILTAINLSRTESPSG